MYDKCLGQRECWFVRTRSCVTLFGSKGMLVSENQVMCDRCLGQREFRCLRTRSCVTGVWVKGNVGV